MSTARLTPVIRENHGDSAEQIQTFLSLAEQDRATSVAGDVTS